MRMEIDHAGHDDGAADIAFRPPAPRQRTDRRDLSLREGDVRNRIMATSRIEHPPIAEYKIEIHQNCSLLPLALLCNGTARLSNQAWHGTC
jgi:hypothetical protein